MLGDVAVDRGLKVDDPAEAATFQPAPGQGGEEALDRVHPRSRGRGEVEDPARMPGQPGSHLRVLVGAVVVQDHVDQLAGRHRRHDGVEEAQELLVCDEAVVHRAVATRGAAVVQENDGGPSACRVDLRPLHRPARPYRPASDLPSAPGPRRGLRRRGQ